MPTLTVWIAKIIKVYGLFVTIKIEKNGLIGLLLNKTNNNMKLLVVYNPNAGGGHAKKIYPEIKKYIKAKGLQAEYLLTEHSGHAVTLVKEANLGGFDGVIASGGDGTLHEVINGYYQNTSTNKPPVGIIINGTGNAFSRDLSLKATDWKKAIDNIAANNVKKIDVAKYEADDETNYFVNIIGIGFVADIAKRAVFWKFLGNVAYTLAVLLESIFLKSIKVTMILDGKEYERDCIFLEVSNSRYTGTTFLMAPNAILDDGYLDVTIVNKITRIRLMQLLQTVYTGAHIHEPEVETFKAKKITVITEKPSTLIPDGEIKGTTPIDISCLHQDLGFFWFE